MFDLRRLFAALRPPLGPRDAFERGLAALDSGRHAEAAREFETALGESRDDSRRAEVHNKLGVALVALGRRDEALAGFCRALGLDERCAPALVNIGNLLLEEGHTADAIDYYEGAIAADERYHVAYGNLGVALKRLGRPADAVRALRSAARLEVRQRAARS